MEKVLFLAHIQTDGTLSKTVREGLTGAQALAKSLGSNFEAGFIGNDVDRIAASIAGCGAQKVYSVSGPDFEVSRYATDAAAFEGIIKKAQATVIVSPMTSRCQRVMPGVAQRLGGRIDTHISQIQGQDGKIQVDRWFYRQRMVATLNRTTRPWFLMVDAGVYAPHVPSGAIVAFETVNISVDPSLQKTKVTGFKSPASGTQTIRPEAELLFVAGAGWTKKQSDGQVHVKDAENLILSFLNQTNASLGSSKSLVDQSSEGQAVLSCLSHLNQVGQTGSTPRHPKGLSTCCHGEEPHVVGWRFVNERRAINLDANCGWAQGKADILYVADAFEVVKKVNELLEKK